MALAAAMAVPPLALSLLTTARWVEAERARLETVTRENAQRAMSQVDRFLVGRIAMLQALATSPAIDLGDFQRLDRQSRELLDLQGLNIVMRDLNGQQLVNTRVPWGTPLPRVPNYAADGEVATRRGPVISDLYPGVMAGGPLIRVIVPVIRNGEVWYTLTASLSPQGLSALLAESGLAVPYTGSIVDRAGTILARAPYDDALIGRPLPGFLDVKGEHGTWAGTNPQGIEVYATFQRSPLSGWLYTAGIDKRLLDAPLYRSLAWLAALALLIGAGALAASSYIARRILSAHRRLEAAAQALGDGEVVTAPETPLSEANRIALALEAASVRIRQQADELVTANHDLEERVRERTREVSDQASLISATLENMDQGLIVVEADGTIPICNERAMELLDLPPAMMASRPHFMDVLGYQVAQGDFAEHDGALTRNLILSGDVPNALHTYERERPNGLVLEIRTMPLATGGAVRTYTDITARKAAERLSQHMARHDGLTGLPNRTLFRERLAALLDRPPRDDGGAAVLCLDLDRFKAVNDAMGHPAGDALLRVVADRLGALIDSQDVVARLGGDEFSIIQTGGIQPHAASALARRIIEEVGQPIDLGGQAVYVGTSVGIAVAPGDGESADQLFKNADLALYRAKNAGRGTFRFYDPNMSAVAQARRELERDLRQALARREFELHYQPILDIASGDIRGFEALLRWTHPGRGVVSPAEFIPVTEDSRLIIPIGSWVLRQACLEAASWPGHVRVLVNISAVQVEDPGLVASVLSAIAASGLSPSRLQLEITETVLLDKGPGARATLATLRELGVKVALDDFGTGYASLGYLRDLPLDGLKVDRSFVQGYADPITGAIFEAIAGLGRTLAILVTAEGVETQAQLEHARRLGCGEAQGFLFSPAVPAAEARRLLDRPAAAAAA